ncbi:hypothetical protein MRB53_014401 [Persea americana]|uniref:Uncharacterized protein n=1 Tax=Persea americana TaxID=3435 RepID=A0ACC2KAT9_PERAE|nr:hypothetical protein MRB53_014401 [Persea americana]|eukprot:TRINITY_DN22877_c0_g2_i1.p1 TRINITY_DN22877_c0_g2~~TRINITY_DN22877_c0_g2_i1.p1  ORF type:complete len:215 (-),score=46.45 TRINITY_DN22877_c0_g2_i1:162-806(-)
MEKQARSKSAVLSFLSKTAAAAFSKPPFSPGREKNSIKLKGHTAKGLSGPIISIVPSEARRKSKNGSFREQEPTSPKVSCIGQIKHKKKICHAKRVPPPIQDRKKIFAVGRVFRGAKAGRRKSDADADKVVGSAAGVPSLGQMKRFSSGRDALANFDWEDGGESDEEEFRVPHSAPLERGGVGVVLEPRAEVNLWKRRSREPPRPLQLNCKKKT